MTRLSLSVIVLVIITRIVENRCDVTDIDQLRYKLFRLKDLFNNTESRDNGLEEETYFRLIELYKEFCAELDDAAATKCKRPFNWHKFVTLGLLRNIEEAGINYVMGLYAKFTWRLNKNNTQMLSFDFNQWMDFAETVLQNPYFPVSSSMDRITDFVEDRIISRYKGAKSHETYYCEAEQSEQRSLLDLYNMIAFTEIKGFAIVQFSHVLLGLHNNQTLSEELIKTEREYNVRTKETLRAVKTALALTPRELWRCEPRVHKEGSTYTEIKKFLQGYILSEIFLHPSESCPKRCENYRSVSIHFCLAYKCSPTQQQCRGRARNCQSIDSELQVCLSERGSSRHYEYFENKDGLVFGSKEPCRRNMTKGKVRRFEGLCSYCMCYCEDNNIDSDGYFSLKEATSNIQVNRVVTGIKFTKVNRVIHLQIQEGELLPRGGIFDESVEWKDVDNFLVTDRNVQNGRDYHRLDWENRALDLDDLVAPESHLLTGVRFRLIGTHLHFEIRVTSFNFTTGLLMDKSTWLNATDIKDPAAVEEARTELKLTEPDVPTRLKTPARPDSKSNQYLNFGPTDLIKDAAQTTIPFLDIQPVVTNPPFPLSGAGIFHKGSDESGGFVALRVITYDFSNHLNIDVPPPVNSVNETTAV